MIQAWKIDYSWVKRKGKKIYPRKKVIAREKDKDKREEE